MGIASLEDKIVQQAVAIILNAIYEVDFKGFSYGFRPGRSPHQALDALNVGICRRFGRYAVTNREKRGEGKPETFDFLGFTHDCGTKNGRLSYGAKRRANGCEPNCSI